MLSPEVWSFKLLERVVTVPYTVDFCCVALKLIVEVDGEHHFSQRGLSRDRIRDQQLTEQGY